MHEWRNINTKNDIKGVLLFLAHPYSNYRDVKRGLLSSIMRMLHILISYLFLKKKYFYKSEHRFKVIPTYTTPRDTIVHKFISFVTPNQSRILIEQIIFISFCLNQSNGHVASAN